jgi:glucokinase
VRARTDKSILVYDVGGSHVSAAVCIDRNYELGSVVSAAHPAEQRSEAFLDLIYALGVEASAGNGEVCGAELAMPGPFDFATGISQMRHKLPYLFGVELRKPLADRFGWSEGQVRFLHDSSAFLLGEVGAGAARGVARAVGITLGTGIGSAFAINGHLATEGPGIPAGGEIWNLPFQGGIVEDFISTRAIQRNYEKRAGVIRDVRRIALGAATDPLAGAAFVEFGRQLGLALRMALMEFAPDVIVLGGGIARSSQLFLNSTLGQVSDFGFELKVSALGDRSALVGAGVAWFNGCSDAEGRDVEALSRVSRSDAI